MVGMFLGLGIKSLRGGGNTLDAATAKVATPGDIDALYAFAKAAGVKVIYSVKMRHVETAEQVAADAGAGEVFVGEVCGSHGVRDDWERAEYLFCGQCAGWSGVGAAPLAATRPAGVAVLGGVGDSRRGGDWVCGVSEAVGGDCGGGIVKEVPEVKLCGPSSTPGKVAWAGPSPCDERVGAVCGESAVDHAAFVSRGECAEGDGFGGWPGIDFVGEDGSGV